MGIKKKSLTDSQIQKLEPRYEPHWVATNLYLKVGKKAKTWWVYKDVDGRKKKVVLGEFSKYPTVKKAMAAGFAAEDELVKPEPKHRLVQTMDAKTTVADAWVSHLNNISATFVANRNGRKPKSVEQWEGSLRNHLQPIAHMPILDLTVADVVAVLKPIWHTKIETAQRARQRLEAVINSAQAQIGQIGMNPAESRYVVATLGKQVKPETKHFKAPEVQELNDFFKRIRDNDSPSADALRWMAATASRGIETSRTKLSQIDLKNDVWTVQIKSPNGTKTWGFPLTCSMKAYIKLAEEQVEGDDYVFSVTGKKQLSDVAMIKFVKENNNGAEWTPHGIRACFRTWAANQGVDRIVAELCLSHEVRSKVERTYDRSDRLEERRALMEKWSKEIGL